MDAPSVAAAFKAAMARAEAAAVTHGAYSHAAEPPAGREKKKKRKQEPTSDLPPPAATAATRELPPAGQTKKKKRKASASDGPPPAPAPAAKRPLDGSAGSLPDALPFVADPADHAETPAAAYEDVAPILRGLAATLGKQPAALRVWDPYYCTGAATRRLEAVGFPHVHHRCEDFYALIESGRIPEHDVLVTNPPYSSDHMQRLFAHCVSSGKPWALLLPWTCVRKPWFRAHVEGGASVHYLVPRRRYFFLPPASMRAEGRERVTAPYETFWCLSLGSEASRREVVAAWRASGAAGGEGDDERCRLGVGFKKRRGTPGFHTLLDENGLLIGRPAPEGWEKRGGQ